MSRLVRGPSFRFSITIAEEAILPLKCTLRRLEKEENCIIEFVMKILVDGSCDRFDGIKPLCRLAS